MNFVRLGIVIGLFLGTSAMADLSPMQQEWHEYCEMTIHITVDGWEAETSAEEVLIPINAHTLKCDTQIETEEDGKVWTTATASLKNAAVSSLTSTLKQTVAIALLPRFEGAVSEATVCAPIKALFVLSQNLGGYIKAKAARKLIRQDWTSEKNSDVKLLEEIDISLDGKTIFTAANSTNTLGKYCSQKPQR